MSRKVKVKIIVDTFMVILMMLLMSYSLIGENIHEGIGVGMFVLFVMHHILNAAWMKNLCKGRYTAYRILQTILVLMAFVVMAGSMISGVVLSRYAFSFLNVSGGASWARAMHMVCAYWGFAIISLHFGLHWGMIIGITKKAAGIQSPIAIWAFRIMALLLAGYGVYAFARRQIGSYMFLKSQYVYFDFGEPLALFLLDYVAVMGMFVFIGHYLSAGAKRFVKQKRNP